MKRSVSTRRSGFTLLELLLAIAIIGVLASLLLPALARARESARAIRCGSQMRQIALAIQMYANDYNEFLPRSSHSAFMYGQLPWSRVLAPYLGANPAGWTNLFNGVYRCPSKTGTGTWSYGLNVYFELTPSNDDYTGSPAVWPRLNSVPSPSTTILLAEVPGSVDHVMAHFWNTPADATDVAARRHHDRACYAFVDGHIETLRLADTYAPASGRDRWNPSRAR